MACHKSPLNIGFFGVQDFDLRTLDLSYSRSLVGEHFVSVPCNYVKFLDLLTYTLVLLVCMMSDTMNQNVFVVVFDYLSNDNYKIIIGFLANIILDPYACACRLCMQIVITFWLIFSQDTQHCCIYC